MAEVLDFGDVPLAVLLQQENLRKAKARKKGVDLCNLPREGRPNPVHRCGTDDGGWVFTEDMLQRVPRVEGFPAGPEDPFHIRHTFFCMICRVNVSMRARGIYEIKRHYQSPNHLRQTLSRKVLPVYREGDGYKSVARLSFSCRKRSLQEMGTSWDGPQLAFLLWRDRKPAVCVHQCWGSG